MFLNLENPLTTMADAIGRATGSSSSDELESSSSDDGMLAVLNKLLETCLGSCTNGELTLFCVEVSLTVLPFGFELSSLCLPPFLYLLPLLSFRFSCSAGHKTEKTEETRLYEVGEMPHSFSISLL